MPEGRHILTTEIRIEVAPHHSEKRPGYNVMVIRTIKQEEMEIEDKLVLRSFRRIKSDSKHRLTEANEFADSVARMFGIMNIVKLSTRAERDHGDEAEEQARAEQGEGAGSLEAEQPRS